jgi:hypothetical protein
MATYKFDIIRDDAEFVRAAPIVEPIEGFPGYEIDTLGNVFSNGNMLKPGTDGDGYLRVKLSKNKTSYTRCVSRLVAHAFIENPDDKPCVDHINNDRTNNCVYNLRWVTVQENNFNRSVNKKSITGIKGVSFCERMGIYRARIKIDGKGYELGYFDDIDDAQNARVNKARQLYGCYINKVEIHNY